MKYKSSPQSGQRNVKLHKRNRQQKHCQSTGWRKSIAEFKTKQRSWKKIKETKTEEIHEQEQHYCSEHRPFVDPNISHAMFSNLDESVHRMWNIFNWGQSMETMLANWLSTRHVQQGMPMGFGHFERFSNRSASFHNISTTLIEPTNRCPGRRGVLKLSWLIWRIFWAKLIWSDWELVCAF